MINEAHLKHVRHGDSNFSNHRLLQILRRRGVADMKRFIGHLNKSNQTTVVEELMNVGAVAVIRTFIDQSTKVAT